MRKSLLALAVSLAAVSSAHAGWDSGNLANATVGNGETLLVIFDENSTHQVSFAQDLGDKATFDLYHNNIGNAAFTQNWTLDPTALSVFSSSNPADLRWAVVSFHNGQVNGDATLPSGSGFQATTNSAPATKLAFGDIQNATTVAQSFSNQVNGVDSNYALNKATTQSAALSNYLGDAGTMGRFLHNSQTFDTTGAIGDTLGYYEFDKTGSGRTSNSTMTAFAGTWKLDLTGGTVTYNQVSSVPVPAAAWMMGSALLGLGSIARRRRV